MKFNFESELEPIGIDEKNGVIRGAVACTAGVIAKGHSLQTDSVLLHQLLESALEKGDKLPVHLDHKSGAAGCVGTAQHFRLTDGGQKLRCDLHLFKSHDRFKQVVELLSNLHETAGLSASFVGESENGRARCSDFLATDIVIFPAAAPNGLFSARHDDDETENESDDMTEPTNEELLQHIEELMSHIEHVEAVNEELLDAVQSLLGDDDGEEGEDEEEGDDDDQEAVISERGARGGPETHDHQADLRTHDFESDIEALQLTGMDARTAHIEALKSFARAKYQTLNL